MTDNKLVRLLTYVTGLVNQELLLQNEYLAAENRILRAHLPARLRLSADDHPLLRYGIATLVGAEPDMELVAQASTGQEAIEQFRLHQPDVTLMDLQNRGNDLLSAESVDVADHVGQLNVHFRQRFLLVLHRPSRFLDVPISQAPVSTLATL